MAKTPRTILEVAGREVAIANPDKVYFPKRAPENRPGWIETVEIAFPSGRTAHEVVVRDAAQLLWIVNLGCIDLNPHPVRADDLEHPEELRVDLDPGPGVEWDQIRRVALVVRDVLADHGLVGWPSAQGKQTRPRIAFGCSPCCGAGTRRPGPRRPCDPVSVLN